MTGSRAAICFQARVAARRAASPEVSGCVDADSVKEAVATAARTGAGTTFELGEALEERLASCAGLTCGALECLKCIDRVVSGAVLMEKNGTRGGEGRKVPCRKVGSPASIDELSRGPLL